jgi:hypothetical protein
MATIACDAIVTKKPANACTGLYAIVSFYVVQVIDILGLIPQNHTEKTTYDNAPKALSRR